ncbi:MAG: condensation domain-containing protein, partial [Candidatus Aminicenantes bacterium]
MYKHFSYNKMIKLDKKNIENILALTPTQEGMLFHYLEDPAGPCYHEQLCLKLSGQIDIACFEQAWNTVVKTNEMLRTVFRWEKLEKPAQIILRERACDLCFYDLSAKINSQQEAVLEEVKANDARNTFDLRQVPFRVILCKIAENKYRLIISNHHILYDGWSTGIILREFFEVYQAL